MMGNSFQRFVDGGCFNQCLGRRYKQWKETIEFDGFNFRNRISTATSRNFWRSRINEYLSWALNRSRSPLLLDDGLSGTSQIETNNNGLCGVNSVSWISDAAASDASHAMYREMDPYNYASMTSSFIPSPTSSVTDSVETSRDGTWVAVTKLTNSKNQPVTTAVFVPNTEQSSNPLSRETTTVPHCDEEVDGPELARLARNLWPDDKSNKRPVAIAKSEQPNTPSHPPGGIECKARPRPAAAARPQDLHLRPQLPRQPVQLFQMVDPLQSNLGYSDMESPVELDWDHEPGTGPFQKRKKAYPHPADDSRPQGFYGNELFDTRLFPIRTRRPRAVLPDQDSSACPDVSLQQPSLQPKRWSCSEKLFPPPQNVSDTHCSEFPSLSGEVKSSHQHPSTNELVDSGFVGLSQSIADADSDGGDMLNNIDRRGKLSEFVWDHETFDDTRPRLHPHR